MPACYDTMSESVYISLSDKLQKHLCVPASNSASDKVCHVSLFKRKVSQNYHDIPVFLARNHIKRSILKVLFLWIY